MPFSSKLVAEYVELINNELDKIPINNVEDFTLISAALNNIPHPANSTLRSTIAGLFYSYNITNSLQEAIAGVVELLNNPDSYVQDASNYAEFQNIIYTRITQKISEFQNMSLVEKQRYIHNQQSMRLEREASSRQVTAIAEARQRQPQPAEHTTGPQETEEQWLTRIQNQVQITEAESHFITATHISLMQFFTIPAAIRAEMMQRERRVLSLMRHISLEELVSTPPPIRAELIQNAYNIDILITSAHLSLTQLFQIDPEIRAALYPHSVMITSFMRDTHISFAQLVGLDPTIRIEFINATDSIVTLMRDHLITLEELVNLTSIQRQSLLSNPQSPESAIIVAGLEDVRRFIQITHIPSARFFAINPVIRTEIIRNAQAIAFIMQNTTIPYALEIASLIIIGQIPLRRLNTLTQERFQEVVFNWERILCLITQTHVSFSELFGITQSTRAKIFKDMHNVIHLITQAKITPTQLNKEIVDINTLQRQRP